MEPTIPSKKEELHKKEFENLYEFFKVAEQNARHLTSKEIRDEGFHRSIKTVRKYISRHWSWFLHPIDPSKRPIVYRCQGIGEYPKDYFIQAHKPNQMQYFYHFAKSIEAYEKREKRKEEERQKHLEAEASVEQLPVSEIEQLEETADQQKAPPALDIQIAEEMELVEPVEQAEPDEASDTLIEGEETKLIHVEPKPVLHLQALPESHEHAHIMPPSVPSEETPEPPRPVESPLEDNSEKLSEEAGIKIHNISEPPKSPRLIILIIVLLALLALIVAGYITFRK